MTEKEPLPFGVEICNECGRIIPEGEIYEWLREEHINFCAECAVKNGLWEPKNKK